ncbi:MAG: site-specific integrase [Deltaproteobacteria bacterium]|nr:site-specific integrase [Deltaproteobacteria bacterium]
MKKGSYRVAMKRERTKYPGVYQRQSDTRVHNGKADACYDITYKRDGKKIWEKVGWVSEGYTAKVASELRSSRLRNIRHGEELPKEKTKAPYFKEVGKKYIEWVEVNKSRSGRDDKYLYKNHLASAFDDKRLDAISAFDLERLKNKLTQDGLAPGSVKHCLVLFRQMFNKAVLWGMHKGDNPIKGVKLPTLQNQRERFLTYDEASLLLDELKVDQSRTKNPGKKKDPQLHDMALLSLHCGFRAGEIFNLKGQDLDFGNGLINISDPKNKENRKAFMTEAVKEGLMKRVPGSPDEYVFKDRRHGGKITAISAAFRKAVNKLEFNKGITDPRQKVTFHSLRHTFASWLALQGETILTIKELLGHKSLAMTARYAHLMPEHKRQATLNLEKNFIKKVNDSKKIK